MVAQIVGVVTACLLWTGVASPGLKLLPGLDGLADESISISLQSAVLGIDDGSNRPAEERARDAAAVLGLTYAESLLSPTALRLGAAARADGTRAPSVISLAEIVAGEAEPSSRPETRTEAAAPVESTSFPEAATPPAEPPSTAPPAPPAPSAPAPAGLPVAPFAPAAAQSVQAVEFTSAAPERAIVGGTYAVSARASSGLPVKYAVVGKKDVCKVSGSIVSFRQTGTCVIEAHQPGSAKFKEARAQQTIQVIRAPQAIVFSTTPPSNAVAGGSGYTVAAVAELRPPGHLRSERGERRRLQGLGLPRLADGRRHVHRRGRPGRQQRLRARAARAAVLRRRRGAAGP